MKLKTIYFILIILISCLGKSQNLPKDTIYGNIKKIKEKVIFLTDIENPQLLYYDDYGHSGFMGPESTISRFYNTWFSTHFCYYINYERFYNPNRTIKKEIWYGKKNNFINSYRYIYDDKDRLISTVDSSEYSIDTRNHYFEDYDNFVEENMIYESIKSNVFSHKYSKYKNGKVINIKEFEDNGTIHEFIYHYNKNGKLDYRIFKNPNTWKKLSENSYSYGVYDSIGITYKDMINEYNSKNQLIKTIIFEPDSRNYENKIIANNETVNIYEGDNLITKYIDYKNGSKSYFNFRYNKFNQLIAKYCCTEDLTKSIAIQNYTYKNNVISHLSYTEEDFETKKMKNYNISYSYNYDKHKNWIEITKTVNGKDLYKWVRKIEYYKDTTY